MDTASHSNEWGFCRLLFIPFFLINTFQMSFICCHNIKNYLFFSSPGCSSSTRPNAGTVIFYLPISSTSRRLCTYCPYLKKALSKILIFFFSCSSSLDCESNPDCYNGPGCRLFGLSFNQEMQDQFYVS